MTRETQMALFDDEEPGDDDVARSLLDQLLSDSKLYKSSESYKQLFAFVTRLRNVAPFNAMLLQVQKPGLTYAASAFDWQEEFHRGIKEDARPLLILWPFAPVVTVYDVLDTYDLDNPESTGLPENMTSFFATGEIKKEQIQRFIKLLARKDIKLQWFDKGDANAGRIQRLLPAASPQNRPGSKEDQVISYRMKVNQNHTPPVQFTTIAHELAHLCLGHLGPNKKLNIPKRRSLTLAEVEIEAETTAYLVCERNGVTSKSEAYLSNFVDGKVDVDHIDIYQIMRAAGQIETLLKLTTHTKFEKPQRSTQSDAQ